MYATNRKALILVLAATAAISLLLSLFRIWADPVINQDAILYLQSATYFQSGDWASAGKLYNWPFFSLLIAGFSTLFHLPVEMIGYALSSIFIALTCFAFVLIVHELGGTDRRILWLAALIILCFSSLNDDRHLIIRDHGYWAFISFSTLFFFQLCKQPRAYKTVLLIVCALLATLFRIEGVLFLIGLPVLVLLSRMSLQHISARVLALRSMLIVVFFTLCLSGGSWLVEQDIAGFSKTSQISKVIERAERNLLDSQSPGSALNKTRQFLSSLGPNSRHSTEYALGILVLTIVVILLTEVAKTLTPLYLTGLLIWLYAMGRFPRPELKRPWILLMLFNISILVTFTASRFFLAGRYPVALSLILILPLPFVVDHFLRKYQQGTLGLRARRIAQFGFCLFVAVSLDGLISLGASKVYQKEAGLWLAQNTNPAMGNVYFDNGLVKYYSGTEINKRQPDGEFNSTLKKIKRKKLNNFDYLALSISHREPNSEQQLTDALNRQPIKIFGNRRQDKVLIFQRPETRPQ